MTSEQLRELMLSTGLTVGEVAKRLGVHFVTVYRWLNGTRAITHAYAFLIREKLKAGSEWQATGSK